MRVVVTGGRDWGDYGYVRDVLSKVDDWTDGNLYVAHGACPTGVDNFTDTWAPCYTDHEATKFPADWNQYGNAAGPIRNTRMLEDFKPDLVVAFPGGTGTADCVKKAQTMGITVLLVGKNFPF